MGAFFKIFWLLIFCVSCIDTQILINRLKSSSNKNTENVFGIKVDRNFGEKGQINFNYEGEIQRINSSLNPQAAFKLSNGGFLIYAKGNIVNGNSNSIGYLLKFNSSGKLDTQYSKDGVFDLLNEINSSFYIYTGFENNTKILGVDALDRVYVSGKGQVIRITANGELDLSYGNKGFVSLRERGFEIYPEQIVSFESSSIVFYVKKSPFENNINYQFELQRFSYQGKRLDFDENNYNLKLNFSITSKIKFVNNSFNNPDGTSEFVGVEYSAGNLNIFKVDNVGNKSVTFNYNYAVPAVSSSLSYLSSHNVGDNIYVVLRSMEGVISSQGEIVRFNKTSGVFAKITPAALVASNYYNIDSSIVAGDKIYFYVKSKTAGGTTNPRREFVLTYDTVTETFNSTALGDIDNAYFANLNFVFPSNTNFYVFESNDFFVNASLQNQMRLKISKYDQNFNLDTTYETNGIWYYIHDFDMSIDLMDVSKKVLIDNEFNSYYLLSYEVGSNQRVEKILKLNKNLEKVTAFQTGSLILPILVNLNYLSMEIVDDFLYLFYEKFESGNLNLYVKKFNKETGVLDTTLGVGGEVLVNSIVKNITSFSKAKTQKLQLNELIAFHSPFGVKKSLDNKLEIIFEIGDMALLSSDLYYYEYNPIALNSTLIKKISASDVLMPNGDDGQFGQSYDFINLSTSDYNYTLNGRKLAKDPFRFDEFFTNITSGSSSVNILYKNDGGAVGSYTATPLTAEMTSISGGGNIEITSSAHYIVDIKKSFYLVSQVDIAMKSISGSPNDRILHYIPNLKVYDRNFNLKVDLKNYNNLFADIYHNQNLFVSLLISNYFSENKIEFAQAVLDADLSPSGIGLSDYLLTLMKINRVQIILSEDGNSIQKMTSNYLDYFDYLDQYYEEYALGRGSSTYKINGSEFKIAKKMNKETGALTYSLYKVLDTI